MAPTLSIYDGSIPSSAHALQVQKLARALSKNQDQKKTISGFLPYIALATISFTGTIVGYLLHRLLHPNCCKRGNRESDWSCEEDMIFGNAEDDELANGGFDRKFRKR